MATIGKGLFGGFRGKIANVQGSSWFGKDTIQGWNDRANNIPSTPQLAQQSVMKFARWYAEGTKYIASLMYVRKKQKNIGVWAYNCKTWLNNTDADGTIHFESFQFGRKVLPIRVFHLEPILPFNGGFTLAVNPTSIELYQDKPVVWSMFWYNLSKHYIKEVGVTFDHNAQLYIFTDSDWKSGDGGYFIGMSIVTKLGFQSDYGVNFFIAP